MKVLLVQSVKNVGKPGDIKEVADGYARNYLIPRGLATVANTTAVKQAQAQRDAEARREGKFASENQTLAARLGETQVTLRAKTGAQGRLYGAITAADIAAALEEKLGQAVDRRRIELDEPIRTLGEHKVPIRIARDLVPQVTVTVESEGASS
ncbi:MAG TPA: 50S ribosomal protein L9 [Chloroflexota bacterium]|jgi:large subunit ribosomal protein L9|nr:50S ribosomal protein L9 [Chloroflexota bacterium]